MEIVGALCEDQSNGIATRVADLEIGIGGGVRRGPDTAGQGVEVLEGEREGGLEGGEEVGNEVGCRVGKWVEEDSLDGAGEEPDDVEEG